VTSEREEALRVNGRGNFGVWFLIPQLINPLSHWKVVTFFGHGCVKAPEII